MVQVKKHRVLLKQRVFFGDCDPAGIVFYPNIFSWFDRAFHMLLDPLGGHAAVCKRLDALGMGVMDAKAQFRRPCGAVMRSRSRCGFLNGGQRASRSPMR